MILPSTRPATAAGSACASEYVDGNRLWQRHVDMARIGATSKGGVRRLALSPEEAEAQRLLAQWARQLGFAVSRDAIGNLFVRREGTDPCAEPVLSGSHLDSQPSGGRFDGVFGVLAALEALEAIEQGDIATRRPIEVVSWTNEEGCRFMPGCTGSIAFSQPSRLPALLALEDAAGVSIGDALEEMRAALPDISGRPLGGPVAAFVEAHIEQGPELEAAGKGIGVVTGIQGTRRFEITVHGEDAHAGTTPRRLRRDALSAAVAMITALEQVFHDDSDRVRFTVGRLDVSPNAPSVIPGRVFFTIDFRHPRDEVLTRRGDQVRVACEASRKACAVEVKEIIRTPPIAFPTRVVGAIETAARRLGLASMPIFSGAGHDAQNLFHVTPTGMIFVPCEKGISHNERENARPDDLTAGARVLTEVLVELAND